MNRQKAFTYFEHTFDIAESTNGWWYFQNPFDSSASSKKIKMCVNFKYNTVKDWSTGYRDSIMTFIREFEGINYEAAKELISSFDESDIDVKYDKLRSFERKDVVMPQGFRTILEGNTTLANRARTYLKNRGFDLELLDEEGFGYCNEHDEDEKEDYFGYIIIPFKSEGTLDYFIGRDFIGNFLRYKNPGTEKFGIGKSQLLFNQDALYYEDEVFVTEGWSDAMTIGRSGIATLGWDLSSYQLQHVMLSPCKDLVFLHDYGFRKETVKAAMKFIGHKNVYVPNLDPIMDENKKDVNELGRELIMQQYLKTKEKLTRSNAVKILSNA